MTKLIQDTPEEAAAREAQMRLEIAAEDAHYERLERLLDKHLADDVRLLHALWEKGTGASEICAELLRTVHSKRGSVHVCDLAKLDIHHQAAALRLVHLCAGGSVLPDSGLDGILSQAEIASLIDDLTPSP